MASHPLNGSVDQPSVRVLQTTREPDAQEAGHKPEEPPPAAEGSGGTHMHTHTHKQVLFPISSSSDFLVKSLQEDLFSSTNCNGAVASNEDDAIELMMYRQSSFRCHVAPPLMPGSPGPVEPLPDELGPAERGEAPPLREVKHVSS